MYNLYFYGNYISYDYNNLILIKLRLTPVFQQIHCLIKRLLIDKEKRLGLALLCGFLSSSFSQHSEKTMALISVLPL